MRAQGFGLRARPGGWPTSARLRYTHSVYPKPMNPDLETMQALRRGSLSRGPSRSQVHQLPTLHRNPQTLYPSPQTPNPQPLPPNPQPSLSPSPPNSNPRPQIPNPRPQILDQIHAPGHQITQHLPRQRPRREGKRPRSYSFNLEFSCNEVYCTNALLLLIKIMLCSKLDSQKVVNGNFFPIRSSKRAGFVPGEA